MNLMNILKQIFPSQPTLEEFIASHKPENTHDVEFLEKQYDRLLWESAYKVGGYPE